MKQRGAKPRSGFLAVFMLAACAVGVGPVGAGASLHADRVLRIAVVPAESSIALQQPQMAPICGSSMRSFRATTSLTSARRTKPRPRV